MTLQPKLVVDAKALDLLVKPEVQAASGSEKRTTIEVLVTQDKTGLLQRQDYAGIQ